VVGQIIQHILDKGFFVRYEYDPKFTFNNHLFTIRKYCGERVFECRWCVDGEVIERLASKDVLLGEADFHMQEVNKVVTQARLIEEALQPNA
jgi:hypothetical protein